jgi:uncharacterized protein YukE
MPGVVVVSGRLVAELAVLARGEEAFGQVLSELRAVLAELDQNLSSGLVAWTGEAKATYERTHREWRAAADDMADGLDRLRRVIGVGHRNYGRSLAANVAMWHGA